MRSDLKIFNFGVVKNALGHQSDSKILKSTIFQVRIDELTWFLACKYRFKKLKRLFVNF